jgi:8-oxo-dGTP pyrophosphatase MutT (NUDIX family)
MKIPTIAKVIVCNDAGEILLLRRSQSDNRRPGQWDLPGGNVERGEDIRAAVIREAAEEAGITLADPIVVYGFSEPLDPPNPDILPTWIFFAEKVSGRPDVTLSFEHDDYTWMPLAQVVDAFEYERHKRTFRYVIETKVLDYL